MAGVSARLRLAGHAEALADAGIGSDPRLVAPAPAWHRADGAAAMRHLLATGVRPDAVFCFNDTLALGALRALHEAGLRVPPPPRPGPPALVDHEVDGEVDLFECR